MRGSGAVMGANPAMYRAEAWRILGFASASKTS